MQISRIAYCTSTSKRVSFSPNAVIIIVVGVHRVRIVDHRYICINASSLFDDYSCQKKYVCLALVVQAHSLTRPQLHILLRRKNNRMQAA